jgi:uncharacterized membrane protein YdjX (TVP38/TMEM64 family)
MIIPMIGTPMSPVNAGDSADVVNQGGSQKSAFARFAPVALIIAALGFGYAMGWQRFFTLDYLAQSRTNLLEMVAAHPIVSRLGFFIVYAVAVAVSFPAASILTIFAGFLFGWWQGGLIVAFAATLGAMGLFLAARSAFGDALRSRVSGPAKTLADGFEKDAFNYLLFLRLAPIFPFFVINIVPALFAVPLRTYATATFFGIIPGTFAYTFLGTGIGSALDASAAAGTTLSVGDLVTPQLILAFFALGAAALLPVIIKRLRAKK